MKKLLAVVVITALFITTGCTNTDKKATTKENIEEVIIGKATWYGKKFHGRKTASGEKFNMYSMSAAHKTLEFGKRAIVTNTKTNKSVEVYINDRGPFIQGVVLDLSYGAFKEIADPEAGFINVKIEVLE